MGPSDPVPSLGLGLGCEPEPEPEPGDTMDPMRAGWMPCTDSTMDGLQDWQLDSYIPAQEPADCADLLGLPPTFSAAYPSAPGSNWLPLGILAGPVSAPSDLAGET